MNEKPQFELAADKPGYLKVKLFYHTWEPKHLRSRVLQTEFKADPQEESRRLGRSVPSKAHLD